MRIHMPRHMKSGKVIETEPIYGVLREVKKFDKDRWQVKISCSKVSIIDNMYLTLTDLEIEMFIREWKKKKESAESKEPS